MSPRKRHQAPEAAAPASTSLWRRQLNNILETQISRFPFLVQMRAVYRQLQDEDRAAWPYIIGLLLLVFIGTYRGERKRVRQSQAER